MSGDRGGCGKGPGISSCRLRGRSSGYLGGWSGMWIFLLKDEKQWVLSAGLGWLWARCRWPPRADHRWLGGVAGINVPPPRQPLGWKRWRGGGCSTIWSLGKILVLKDNLFLVIQHPQVAPVDQQPLPFVQATRTCFLPCCLGRPACFELDFKSGKHSDPFKYSQ